MTTERANEQFGIEFDTRTDGADTEASADGC